MTLLTLWRVEALRPVAFAQNSRDEVRLHGGDGRTVGALTAQARVKQQCYVAFSAKDDGVDASEIAPTLRGMGHNASHPNGGGQVAIAFTQNQDGDVLSGEVMQSLGTNANATGRNVAVAWTQELAASTDIAGTLQRGGEGGRKGRWRDDVVDGHSSPDAARVRASARIPRRLHAGRVSRQARL